MLFLMKQRSHDNKPALGLWARLRLALRTLAFGQLRLKRGDSGMKVTFGETMLAKHAGVATKTTTPETASAVSRQSTRPAVHDVDDAYTSDQIAQMRAELARVLDARPTNRAALTHLTLLEKHLKKSGGTVFQRMPVKLLLKAHEQLMLVSSRHDAIARGELMQALTQTLARRKNEIQPDTTKPATDSGLHSDLRDAADSDILQVQEARLSDFLDADRKG
jgi:hypothetical protein